MSKLEALKPEYRVPLMSEINELPWNGFNAISTFSGCGGSSLGYRMAGFKVLWASEFIDAARESYNANKAPYTIVDGRDIREVQAADILEAIGLKVGELDLLDGSPPCASFSTAGKREAGWGKVKKYSDKKQRTDDLFFEFSRLVRGVQPKVFVAENVSGLVKGTAKGYFLEILADLKAAGYRVKCKVLDAQWLGVPQQRQRTIFVGVREDLGLEPVHPKPLAYRYSVRDALPWVLRHGTAPSHADFVASNRNVDSTMVDSASKPCPTITTGENKGVGHIDSRVIHDTSGLWSTGDVTDKPCPTITVGVNSVNSNYFKVISRVRIAEGFKGENWVDAGSRPYSTVGASPASGCNFASNGGKAEFISSDGEVERRKFTIAELRRICSFPDDFDLTGSYAQQWERLGRAVPPVMMSHVAGCIRDEILARLP